MATTKAKLSSVIQQYLRDEGLTACDLADILEVSPPTVYRWLSGAHWPDSVGYGKLSALISGIPRRDRSGFLASTIAAHLAERGITGAALAKSLGCSPSTVSGWMRGICPSVRAWEVLAQEIPALRGKRVRLGKSGGRFGTRAGGGGGGRVACRSEEESKRVVARGGTEDEIAEEREAGGDEDQAVPPAPLPRGLGVELTVKSRRVLKWAELVRKVEQLEAQASAARKELQDALSEL